MDKDKALSKAKMGILIEGSKFLVTIVFSMNHVWDEAIPTAATNGKEVKYNPDFFMSLSPEERIFIIAHEAWHTALNHLTRGENKDQGLYNQAGDYVINQLLVDAGMKMPKGGLLNFEYKGLSTDQIYELLEVDPNSKNRGYTLEGDIEQNLSEEEKEELEVTTKLTLVKALAKAKMAKESIGTIPNEVIRLIDDLINPKLPWEDLLQRFLTDRINDDFTWSRPNKYFLPEYILPSQYSETLGHIAIAIDTSGSLSKKELTSFLSEINYIHKTFKPSKLTILDCDYKIHNVYEITDSENIMDLEFTGNGGTSFHPVFNYLEDKAPQALIYFTDLYAEPIKKTPDYPILWICTSDHTEAKVGETIYLT